VAQPPHTAQAKWQANTQNRSAPYAFVIIDVINVTQRPLDLTKIQQLQWESDFFHSRDQCGAVHFEPMSRETGRRAPDLRKSDFRPAAQ
jgi:hypothetical protein